MIQLAFMMADESNRKELLAIVQSLKNPIDDFAKSISNMSVAGMKNLTDDIVNFSIDVESKALQSVNKLKSGLNTVVKETLPVANIAFNKLGEGVKSFSNEMNNALDFKGGLGNLDSTLEMLKKGLSFVFESSDYAKKIGDISNSLGLNTEQFSNWADVFISTGGNLDTFQATLKGLKNNFDEIANGSGEQMKSTLDNLGISLIDGKGKSKDLLDILPELATVMEGMNDQEASSLGSQLGLDENTLMLLKKGSSGLQEMLEAQKKMGSITGDDALIAKEFANTLTELTHIARTLALKIGSAILPVLTWFMKKVKVLTDYLSGHKEFVTGFFIGIAVVLATTLLPVLWSTLLPVLAIIAVLTVLGTVCGFVFSYFSRKINETGGFFEGLRNTISYAIEYIVAAFSWLVDAVATSISVIIGWFTFWLDYVFAVVDFIFNLFTKGPAEAMAIFGKTILNALNSLYDKLPNWAKKLFSGIKGFFSSDELTTELKKIENSPTAEALTKGSKSLSSAQLNSQLIATTGSKAAISNNNQVSYQNSFTITSNNPEEVGRIVDEKMRVMNQKAGEHFDNGVIA